MQKKFLKLLAAAAVLINFTAAAAAESWTLPENGVTLHGAAKQNYISEKMNALFHPAPGTAVTKPNFEVPDGWIFEKLYVDGLNVECLTNPAGNENRVVLQIHGGGYVLPLDDGHRNFGMKLGILSNASQTYFIDYRIAPENPYPAALEDAVKAYQLLLTRNIPAENIIVFGDSAGGNLALALSLYLKEKNLPQPKALILISPWTTMQNNLPSRRYNADKDLILGKGTALYDAVKTPAYAKGYSVKNPMLSPIYADLKNLPPMLIQAGGYELFLDECLELAKKAAADNVKVTLTIYPEMSHDFALLLPELQDSLDSFKEIRDFVNSL